MTVSTFAVMSVGIPSAHERFHMNSIEELSKKDREYFMKMVDESVMESDMDKELKEGFNYLDELAYKQKISFYDLILQIYEKHELEERIKEWRKEKGID